MKCGKVQKERMRGKKEVLTVKVGTASKRTERPKGMQDRRIKSANLLKASQVTLILKMSHWTITFIRSSNADAIQLNEAAATAAVELKMRFSGLLNCQANAVASEMRSGAH